MTRFYFHLHNDFDVEDDEGRELADVEAAHRAAETDARYMAAENVASGHLNLDHYVEVTDGAVDPLFRVYFRDVVTITG